MLKDIPIPDGKSKLDPTSLPFIPGSEYDELKSPISLAHEIALKRNLTVYFEVRVNLCVLITLGSNSLLYILFDRWSEKLGPHT